MKVLLKVYFQPIFSIPLFFFLCIARDINMIHVENGRSFSVWNLTF